VRIFDWGKAAVLIAKLRHSARGLPSVSVFIYQYELKDVPDQTALSPMGKVTAFVTTNGAVSYFQSDILPYCAPFHSRKGYLHAAIYRDAGRDVIPCWLPAHKAPPSWDGVTHWPADALAELNRLLGK
jgi:hypothetical protein